MNKRRLSLLLALALSVVSCTEDASAMPESEAETETSTADRTEGSAYHEGINPSSEQPAAENLSAYEMPAFYVYGERLSDTALAGSKTLQPVKDIPASLTIINSDEIERLGVYRLTDALEYSAGITVSPRGDDNLYNMSKIRGFDVSHGNLVVDGMKTFTTTDNLFSPELYGVEQVEILRGPASTLYGTGLGGGTINLATKSPRPINRVETQLQTGSQATRMAAFDANGVTKDGTFYGRVVGILRENELFYDHTEQKRLYFAPSFTKEFSAKTKFTLKTFFQEDTIDGYAYLPRHRLPADPLYGILPDKYFVGVKGWDTYELSQTGAIYELDHTFSDKVSFHQRGSYRHSDIKSYQTTGVLRGPMFTRFGAMIDSEATAYGLDQFLRLRHGGKIRGGDTAIGFDWHYERTLDDQNMRMLSPWDPADIPDYVAGRQKPPVDPDTILPMGELRYWNRETGVYVTHQEKFDRWTLTGGLRRGFYEAYSERDSLREREAAWTGQFGAVYDTKRDFYFYGHWHNSFEPDLALDENDALLPPTRGREFEFGVKYLPKNSSTQITASVFDLRRQNVHVSVPATSYFAAIGEIASKGVELEYRAAINKKLYLLGSYTYLDSAVTKHSNPRQIGLRPQGVPRHAFGLRVDAVLQKYEDGDLTFGLGARYLGARPDESNRITLGGTTVFDASLRLNRGNDALSLHVRNLFNKQYLTSVEPVWGMPTGFAGQDRTWTLSYIHKF